MIIIVIDKSRLEKISQAKVSTNVKTLAEMETKVRLKGAIRNVATEESTCEKALKGVEKLGVKWKK